MYLLDDIIKYVPQDNHKIEQSIKEHTYKQEGVVRAILETVNGNMFYNVEVTVPGASNGTYFLTAIPESDLEYVGEYISSEPEVYFLADIPKYGMVY